MSNLYRGPSNDASYQVLIHLARLTENIIILFSSFWTVDREKIKYSKQAAYWQAACQWCLQLIFRMHNSDPTPLGVENRNFRCRLNALHVNCMILFDKVL
jgi:hypothetical protein